jgi:hypothetical protein
MIAILILIYFATSFGASLFAGQFIRAGKGCHG